MSDVFKENPFIIDIEKNKKTYSSIHIRALAMFIDIVIFMPVIAFNYYNSLFMKNLVYFFVCFFIIFILKVIFEIYYSQTVGKMICQIIVVDQEFKRPTVKMILKRNILPILSLVLSFSHSVILYRSEVSTLALDFKVDTQFVVGLIVVSINFSVILSYLCGFITPKFQTLHDLFANTFCIPIKNLKK